MTVDLEQNSKRTFRVAIAWISTALLLTGSSPAARAGSNNSGTSSDSPLMEEVISAPDTEPRGWEWLYSAYACVYHQKYLMASRWLMYALRQGAGDQILKSRTDIAYLSKGLSKIAAKRHEAAVTDSSCEAQILQALMQIIVGSEDEALDALKRVVLNNPNYPSLQYVKNKIQAMEFEKSDSPWLTPPDVAQIGGKSNRFSKWKLVRFPLRVYIPTDGAASKIEGYRAGDGQLLRTAFDAWQRQSNGKIRFVYTAVHSGADITCAWVSNQKDCILPDAIGVCCRYADAYNYVSRAEIRVLTFTTGRNTPEGFDNQFRKNCLEEVCLHEIGHGLGLNHSSSENVVMCPHAHWQPITTLTAYDVAALNTLYLTNVGDYISAALDAIASHQYKAALAPLDKALMANPKDSQTRETICICLCNAATEALHMADYATAVKLLAKAKELESSSISAKVRERVLKNLHFAYIQAGQAREAEELEKQNPSMPVATKDSAAFLDQYGLKRESIPYYEEALANSPEDPAIRDKFCFLLVMLARDELNNNNDNEAISLLTRAKGLLRCGMKKDTVDKVLTMLRQTLENVGRFDEAEQTYKVGSDLMRLPPALEPMIEEEDNIATLVSAAKIKYPDEWESQTAKTSQYSKVKLAYEQYAEAIRNCAVNSNAPHQPGWAASFIIRHKTYEGAGPSNPIGVVFELRRRLIKLTGEDAVINVECRLPFKKVVHNTAPGETK